MKYSNVLKAMFKDVGEDMQHPPYRVFCSQSVVLMLRQCLNAQGIHKDLVDRLHLLNSRLVSPKMVFNHLQQHPFTFVITNADLQKIAMIFAPKESSIG
jgi:hypothetical protein